jgi:hypothetical protein
MPGKGHHFQSPECLPLDRPWTKVKGNYSVINRFAQYLAAGALLSPPTLRPPCHGILDFE